MILEIQKQYIDIWKLNNKGFILLTTPRQTIARMERICDMIIEKVSGYQIFKGSSLVQNFAKMLLQCGLSSKQ